MWVDGSPRVACVTPVRRVAGREVTTLQGLEPAVRDAWAKAFVDTGASQCGFCTPGIIMRLAALHARKGELEESAVNTALLAHLCRCTGWRTIVEAAEQVGRTTTPHATEPAGRRERDLGAAGRRATLEGGSPQSVGEQVAMGGGGFAEDTAPPDALVAVPDGNGGFTVAETLAEARRQVGKVQGRNSTVALRYPLDIPPGDWDLVLRTTFVEPGYLETDASWCAPGGEPASLLANGGAFGGKVGSTLGEAARRLADEHGRAVRVVLAREDVVRMGPKRPPIAAGLKADGTGIIRVGRPAGSGSLDRWHHALAMVAPELVVEEHAIAGPPVSADARAAGWAEATVLMTALGAVARGEAGPAVPVTVSTPDGARATAVIGVDGRVDVTVAGGAVLDAVVLRSYAIGAAHQGLGWVRSEGVAVDADGQVLDLTIRSFGILSAPNTPPIDVVVEDGGGDAVRASDAVFAAVAGAAWLAAGLPPQWPIERGGAT